MEGAVMGLVVMTAIVAYAIYYRKEYDRLTLCAIVLFSIIIWLVMRMS